jgi:uncharacterized protein YbaA (DUF1428 family)
MRYVDGFVLPVPKRKLPAYKRLARTAARVWRDHGALEYRECVGDDFAVKFGLPFPRFVRPRRGEVVLFSWIVYRSRADRNRVNRKVMKDPRLAKIDPRKMPFDPKRMVWGGFKVLVEA